jgi:NitT/TauT family transport system substrate-binding protein
MRLRLAVCGVAVLFLPAGCASPGSGGGDDPGHTYVLAAGSSRMSYVVTQYLDDAGVAGKEGLRLRYTTSETASNTNLMAGLLSGSYDFAAPGAQSAALAVSKGAPVQIVASIARSTNVLIMRNDVAKRLSAAANGSDKDRVAALKGLTIGTAPPGTSPYDRLRAMLKMSGVNPDKGVRMLSVTDPSALASGLRSKLYDAVWVAVGDSEPLIADGTARYWVSMPEGDFKDLDEQSLVVVATNKTIKAHPDVVRKLRAALNSSAKAILSDPGVAGTLLKKKSYPAMNQKAFDIAWDQGRRVPPDHIDYTRKDFDRTVSIIRRSGTDDSVKVGYDELVWPGAQGKS